MSPVLHWHLRAPLPCSYAFFPFPCEHHLFQGAPRMGVETALSLSTAKLSQGQVIAN